MLQVGHLMVECSPNTSVSLGPLCKKFASRGNVESSSNGNAEDYDRV
jgi:hypothetical protein